jgi:hypothetical protein
MRFAAFASLAAVVCGIGVAVGVVACGSRSDGGEATDGGEGDTGLAAGECDPNNDPLALSCGLPCQFDVQPYCDNGTWACPTQPATNQLSSDACNVAGRPPMCTSGESLCWCTDDGTQWTCPDGGTVIDAAAEAGSPDARDDATNGEDAGADAAADAPLDAAADAPAD